MDARLTSASPVVAGLGRALRLTDLRPGSRGRLLAADLERDDLALLHALGLAERSSFRLCKAGDPWIVQVRGTRIGISQHVAEMLQVETLAAEPAG
jgi:Fe2+ transport system protein FeoA